MAAERLLRLQRRILAYVYTVEARSKGIIAASHIELMQAVGDHTVYGISKPRGSSWCLGHVVGRRKPWHSHARGKITRLCLQEVLIKA